MMLGGISGSLNISTTDITRPGRSNMYLLEVIPIRKARKRKPKPIDRAREKRRRAHVRRYASG
jgi:hypothetical protein